MENRIFSLLFILLCFLFIINGSNLVDGFNGLLTIHLLIINVILFFINLNNGHENFVFIITAQIIVLTCFLLFNFPKATMFLGDSGSYLFGSLVAFNIINTNNLNPQISSFFFCIILFYLFFEVFFSFFRKIYMKKSPLKPDTEHLHMLSYNFLKNSQRFKDCNYLNSITVNIIYFCLIVPAIFFYDDGLICRYWFFSLLVIYFVFYYLLYSFEKKQCCYNFQIKLCKIRNILFIMADQLRWDYLSCYGHSHLKTPNIDNLAKKGVLFESAYVQSPVCGPSRASYYTGRTVFSHGSTWNQVPLPIGELTIGDYLRKSGIRTGIVGKTHMKPDDEGMARLGINKDTEIGLIISEPGFEPYERDDGLHPNNQVKKYKKKLSYNDWLNKLGYDGDNPWDSWANSSEDKNGEILSGWKLRNSNKPARIPEKHSETSFMTNRAIEFIEESSDKPWFLHLSYIKPHWPYIAPAPYHNMFSQNQFNQVQRSE